MKKRNDATLATDVPSFVKIFPYLMKRRCDSLIYHRVALDMTDTVKFLRSFNREHAEMPNIRIFDVMITALAKVFILRPKLNRFIANCDTWQRNELSFLFVVKEALREDAAEHTAIIRFEPDMNILDISRLTTQSIAGVQREGSDQETDKLIEKYLKLPKIFIRAAVSFFSWLEKHGRLPKSIREIDGLHSSAVLANLGSINLLNAPIHHLYEWGTTSMFLTIGRLHKALDIMHSQAPIDIIEVGFTVDERIADGYYIIKSLNLYQKLVQNPQILFETLDTAVDF